MRARRTASSCSSASSIVAAARRSGGPAALCAMIRTCGRRPTPAITRWRRRPPTLNERPLVVGFGPCGLFAALLLAQMGFKPIVLERGRDVRRRTQDTWALWRKKILTPESNVQFGEGGAGLFSDGKLYSQIKDPKFYGRKVMHEFVRAGAPEEILYVSKPHIGTFRLTGVVEKMRAEIIALGGEVRFESKVTDVLIENGQIEGVMLASGETLRSRHVVLALGHSSRDTLAHAGARGVFLEAKPFALGFRIEHPQSLIDRARFGKFAGHPGTRRRRLQAGASRQQWPLGLQLLHVPGRHRGGGDLRAATRGDQRHEPVLAQRTQCQRRHRRRHQSGTGFPRRPARRRGIAGAAGIAGLRAGRRRLLRARASWSGTSCAAYRPRSWATCSPRIKPGVRLGDLVAVTAGLCHRRHPRGAAAVRQADPRLRSRRRRAHGCREPHVFAGAHHARCTTSLQSLNVRGLYPCGEGAGYAGGILSAGVDGIKVAEACAIMRGSIVSHEIRRHQEAAPEEVPRGVQAFPRRRRASGAGAAEGGGARSAAAGRARST